MKELKGKVAVITGSAKGLGRALAERSAREGMNVVLADIDGNALGQAESELKAAGASVLAVVTDVSKLEDMQALAKETIDKFGAAHLLCNAALVHCPVPLAQATLADWKWVIGVNLYGAVNSVSVFLPIMLEQDTECHIVNTTSVLGGFCALPFNGPYNVSEYGVVTFSEVLSLELAETNPNIKVSVLCPDYADTAILDSDRSRPAEFRDGAMKETGGEGIPHVDEIKDIIRATAQAEASPARLADIAFAAIREGKFYVFPHPTSKVIMRERLAHIDQQSNPENILKLMGLAS